MKLDVELVPKTSWGANLRRLLKPKDWDFIRKRQYKLANGVCEICGGRGKNQGRNHDLECHEQWHYDDETYIQTLIGVIALCPFCHEVLHFGLTELRGRGPQALQHLIKVNEYNSLTEALVLIKVAQEKWVERSTHLWEVDVSWLENNNIFLKKKA